MCKPNEFQLVALNNQRLSICDNKNGNGGVILADRESNPTGTFIRDGKLIKNQHGKCLDLAGWSKENAAKIMFWDVNQKMKKTSYGRWNQQHKLRNFVF